MRVKIKDKYGDKMLKEETNEISAIHYKKKGIEYLYTERDEEFEKVIDLSLENSKDPFIDIIELGLHIIQHRGDKVKEEYIEGFASKEVFSNIINKYFKYMKHSKEFLNLLKYIYYDYTTNQTLNNNIYW